MTSPRADAIPLSSTEDIAHLRRAVAVAAAEMGMRTIERTRAMTAASELGRNAVLHGGGGRAWVEIVHRGARQGMRLRVEDDGPGIPDVDAAMTDGYTTGTGLGLGLGGARRLVSELHVDTAPGEGTRVTATLWR